MVVTLRPDEPVRLLADRQGDALRRIDIDGADRRVRDDLLSYVRLLVGGEPIGAALATESRDVAPRVDDVVTKADGNVGYLDALSRALDRAPDADLPSVLSLAELPDDQAGLHRHFLRRIKPGAGAGAVVVEDPATGAPLLVPAWSAVYRPVLRCCASPSNPRDRHGAAISWTVELELLGFGGPDLDGRCRRPRARPAQDRGARVTHHDSGTCIQTGSRSPKLRLSCRSTCVGPR